MRQRTERWLFPREQQCFPGGASLVHIPSYLSAGVISEAFDRYVVEECTM